MASQALACPSDEVLFKAAQDAVKTLPELDDRNKLRLYAHYKQATVGPAQGSRPSIFQQVARAKWDAWSELHNMNNIDAMRGYCSLADEFVPGWRTSVQEGHSSQNQADTTEAQTGVATSCPSDEVLFKAAQDAVKTLPELDGRNKLRLYAHYKQATVGPAQGSRPSIFQQVARAKWDAWSELQNMNNIDAMRGYCSLADEFVPGWRTSVQEGHSSQNQVDTTEAQTGVATSCPSDEVLFKAAQEAVKTLPELDDRNKLRLYAHYKQATVGPAQGSRPSIFQQVARAKWDAWSELQSMNNIDAMRGYCSLADEFVPGWRTSVQEGHSSQNQADTTADQTGVATSCPSDEVLFKAAQDAVKTLPELDDRNKLRLYAHYKQATVGPAQGSRPSIFQQVARAKWDAWSELQNMNNIDAMRGYCSLADEFVPGWRTSVQEGHSSQNQVDTTEDQTGVATSCPSDEVLFKAAQDAVKTLPELDDRNKLRLYAHYKQATVGPAQGSRPSIFQQVARAKWDAWSELQNMNNIDAMRGYCSLADEFVPGWRTSVQEGHSSQNQADTTEDQTGVATSCPSDEVLFKAAQDAVKTLPELDGRNKLRLYAHYKQATVGPAQGSRPSILQQVARAKWDAWSELQSMNNIDAMRGYCSLADEFVPGWRNSVQEGHSSLHPASFQDSSAKLDSLERWGYEDTRFVASSVSKLRGAVGIEVTFTSDRYPVSRKANGLWDFFQEVGLHLKVKDSPKFLPKLPDSESCESTSSLMDLLQLEDELVSSSPLDRLRGGTSQVFSDLWRLRHGALGDRRMPDLVVQPRCEGHVRASNCLKRGKFQQKWDLVKENYGRYNM